MELDRSPPPSLPGRPATGHKGTFGTVLVVGGCAPSSGAHATMIGAPALAARAALRAGCGLAKMLVPAPLAPAALSITPSATAHGVEVDAAGDMLGHDAAERLDELSADASAIVVGPGLGVSTGAAAVTLRCVQGATPVVVDADGLTALASTPELHRDFHAPAVLTPHPGEFRRLAASLRLTHDPTDPASRPAAAEALAQRLGCVVVLKGAGTVVSDGLRSWVCDRGHPCLATAGTGDVLAGLLGGLLAQFFRPSARGPLAPSLYDLARAGVLAHAIAGERWAEERSSQAGLLAGELADLLPAALEPMRG